MAIIKHKLTPEHIRCVIKRTIKFSFIPMFIGISSSCSLFSPVKPVDIKQYVLDKVPANVRIDDKQGKGTIKVQVPETIEMYDTTQMAYSIVPHQIAYFSKNEWAGTPSQMLEPLLITTLQKTKFFHAVTTPAYVGRYTCGLNTQIIKLQQDFTDTPPILGFIVRAQLTNPVSNQVIATKFISIQQPMAYRAPYAGVIAANKALEKILSEIAYFSIKHCH